MSITIAEVLGRPEQIQWSTGKMMVFYAKTGYSFLTYHPHTFKKTNTTLGIKPKFHHH
jgi:hypothetical protein